MFLGGLFFLLVLIISIDIIISNCFSHWTQLGYSDVMGSLRIILGYPGDFVLTKPFCLASPFQGLAP